MKELTKDTKLTTVSGRSIRVLSEIGRGGQGIVYRVVCDNRERALKWYYPDRFRDAKRKKLFFENLMDNMLDGAPAGAEDLFLWPIDVVKDAESGCFGYVMELIPDGYVEFSKFQMKQRFSTYRARVDAMINLAQGFRALHNAGYKYQDINNGNVFIHPEDGRVLICDNDNASLGDRANGVIGKDRYMAPEVALGQKMPDQTTDRYSLAVLLFILACKEHPLVGLNVLSIRILSEKKQLKVFGYDPWFIFDPDNEINHPCPQRQAHVISNWNAVPGHVRKLFICAFARKAMQYKNGSYGASRVTEVEWLEALLIWRNTLVTCSCDNHPEWYVRKLPVSCPRCGKQLEAAHWICLENRRYPAALGMRLTRLEMGYLLMDAAVQYVAEVVENPRMPGDPASYGLRNLSDKTWICILPNRKQMQIPPKRAVQITDGMVIVCGEDKRDRILIGKITNS